MSLSIFTRNVKWLREYYKIPKYQMAQLLGIGITTLNKLEQGIVTKRVKIDILFRIESLFGLTPSQQCSEVLQDR